VPGDLEAVFKALADPTRRLLLDHLRQTDGQTLTELCAPLGMARQSVTQHLAVLEAATLITTVRRGREKLHYLNPVPIHELSERWIGTFDRPRLAALSTVTDVPHFSGPTWPPTRLARQSGVGVV
jgi:DNA-binding transcriptional ArsR family regulator